MQSHLEQIIAYTTLRARHVASLTGVYEMLPEVSLEDGHIYTDLYVKPSDKQLYLYSASCHPPNTKRGLAYGLGLRIRRICEKEKDYERHRQELKLQLRRRGYSGKLIEAQLQKVDKLDRNELLEVKRQDKSARRGPLVVTFSNLLPDMH